jgi:glycerol uptake facilitator-like aquaporin
MSSFSRALLPAGSGPELAAAVTAEALGSALFQLVAGAARAAASGNSAALTGAPSLAPFAIMAAGYAALSSALRPVSGGHLNPALSLAAVLGGRLAAASFLAYAAAQLGGGVVGSMLSSLTVPGARLFRRAGAVGCLAHPASAAAAGGGGGAWLGGSNLWRLAAWEGVSSAAASLALLSHASPAFVALAFASVGAAAAAAAPALGDVVGNPVLVLSPAVAFGCGWGAGPARWAGQALGAAAAAALAVAAMPPLARVAAAPAAPVAVTPTPGGTRQQQGGRGGGGAATTAGPAAASLPSESEREPLLPTTTSPPGL